MTAGAGHAGSAAENAHPERLAAIRNEEERSPSDLGTIKKTRDKHMLSTHHICAFVDSYFHFTTSMPLAIAILQGCGASYLRIALSEGRQPATLRKNSEDRYQRIHQLG
jgi:hypothetical protein